MRFHLSMLFVVIAISMAMHAMASAATPKLPTDPVGAERYDSAVRQAGKVLNDELAACRDHAKQDPKASRRDLIACERTARREFRRDMRQARSGRPSAAEAALVQELLLFGRGGRPSTALRCGKRPNFSMISRWCSA